MVKYKINILHIGIFLLGICAFSLIILKGTELIFSRYFPEIELSPDTYCLETNSIDEFEESFIHTLRSDSLLVRGRNNGLNNLFDTFVDGNIIPFMDIRDSLGYPIVIFDRKPETWNNLRRSSENGELWVVGKRTDEADRMYSLFLQSIDKVAIFKVVKKQDKLYLNILYIQDSWKLHDRCQCISGKYTHSDIQSPKVFSAFEKDFLKKVCKYRIAERNEIIVKIYNFFKGVSSEVYLINICVFFVGLILVLSGILLRVGNPHRYKTLKHIFLRVGIVGTAVCILIVIISVCIVVGLDMKYPEINKLEHPFYLKDISLEEFHMKTLDRLRKDKSLLKNRKNMLYNIDTISIGISSDNEPEQEELWVVDKEINRENGLKQRFYCIYINSIEKVAVFTVFKSREKLCLDIMYIQDSWLIHDKHQSLYNDTAASGIPVEDICSAFQKDFLDYICEYETNSSSAYDIYNKWIPGFIRKFGGLFLTIAILCVMMFFTGIVLSLKRDR